MLTAITFGNTKAYMLNDGTTNQIISKTPLDLQIKEFSQSLNTFNWHRNLL